MIRLPVSLRRRGLLLEALTITWNVIEAAVAIGAGVAARSIALVGFGFDSTIEGSPRRSSSGRSAASGATASTRTANGEHCG